MNKNLFEILCENFLSDNKVKIFEVKKEMNLLNFKIENTEYEIAFEQENKLVFLKNVLDSSEKTIISTWSLDSENSTSKDAKMIADDFIDILKPKSQNLRKRIQHKKTDSDGNVSSVFFANRMITIFPELKSDFEEEKEKKEFRIAIFTKNSVLQAVLGMLKNPKEKNKISKLFKTLSDLYKNGDLDVRSVITMVILNNIEDKKAIEIAENTMSEELQKAWKAALKFKGKKVKPEKIKIKKSFMAKVLEANEQEK